jgi:subtilisin family serine protease
MITDVQPNDPRDPGSAPGPQRRSPIVGDLSLGEGPDQSGGVGQEQAAASPDPDAPVEVIIELNMNYPGGLTTVSAAFDHLWHSFVAENAVAAPSGGTLFQMVTISSKLRQCVLTRGLLAQLVALDRDSQNSAGVIFRAWPDYPMFPQIDRSAPTLKVDAARRSFDASGAGVVWAVVDTGIDATHPHFSELELFRESQPGASPGKSTGGLHRDFSNLVQPSLNPLAGPDSPLTDEEGHGTHVAGIIAGACPPGVNPHVAASDEATDGGFVGRQHGQLLGMAPKCELVSIKVFRRISGVAVTSSAAVIRALEYIRTEVNAGRSTLRIHGVNLSLGSDWDPSHYAAGQSPLCQLIEDLVASGVVVVISAGNNGQAGAVGSAKQSVGVLASITEPGHADACITVGSTHRDAPHVFGVSWTSSKGPTLDGRSKPDIVAPGEWICSAATGRIRTGAGLDGFTDQLPTYAEQSGTSMAAPHVSGVLAGFLSSRPEYIGRPAGVKALMVSSATDLGRDRFAQGAGLLDAMRMLSNS